MYWKENAKNIHFNKKYLIWQAIKKVLNMYKQLEASNLLYQDQNNSKMKL
jgi:hypothetical protein